MLITIGNNTREAMKIMGIAEYPFTVAEIKSVYRKRMLVCHPDRGGDEEQAKKITVAYDLLRPLALSDVTDNESVLESTIQEKKQNEDIFALYKTCENCKGLGKIPVPDSLYACVNCASHICRLFYVHPRSSRFGYICTSSCAGRWCPMEAATKWQHCYVCKGTGKIELHPFNPVIPKAAVL